MSLLNRDISIDISVGVSSTIMIRYDRSSKRIEVGTSGDAVDSHVMSLVSLICHGLTALSKSITIDRFFSPVKYLDEAATFNDDQPSSRKAVPAGLLQKAKWTRAGYLKACGATSRHYKHANTVAEALERVGVFTCSAELALKLPQKRPTKEGNND